MSLPDKSLREKIAATFKKVASDQGKTLRDLTDDAVLLGSGVDSLCLAVIVAQLDDELGIDPFGAADDVAVPVTFGQFVLLYENAAS